MTLQERLFNDMKEALKARQSGKQRLSVIDPNGIGREVVQG